VIRLTLETPNRQHQEVTGTPLDESIRKTWIDIQKRHDVPVNAIGVRIDPKDINTLQVWREAGVDQFVRK